MAHSISYVLATAASLTITTNVVNAETHSEVAVSDEMIAEQRAMLAEATADKGYGPQSPRDIDLAAGNNNRTFEAAPAYTDMNLCNIHFHESAEHKGGEFAKFAGNGDGEGNGGGYIYSGTLSSAELAETGMDIGATEEGSLIPGDTIEVHYVYSTAKVTPGPTLGACLSEAINNPQLRVETQIYVLVNDDSAINFMDQTEISKKNGLFQASNVSSDTGPPIEYAGSTTGPTYNEKGSPFQVTWSVRPEVAKVDIMTVGQWLSGNVFKETYAHGVRNLVTNPDLLSEIAK